MAIADTFCVVSVLMYDTWDDAVASDGPTRLNVSPSDVTACLPPLSDTVKYGLLTCLGRNAIVSLPDEFFGVDFVELALPEPELLSVLLLVEPHAATASARTGTRANFVMDMSLLTGM